MAPVVTLRTEVVHRYVFELRYELGHVYWDRAGRIARELTSREGWDVDSIDPNNCQVTHRDRNMAFDFGPRRLDLHQTQNADVGTLAPVGEFASIAETFSGIVATTLDVPFCTRIGFRVWNLYPMSTQAEAFDALRNLKLFRIDAASEDSLGRPSDAKFSLVVERPKHMLRIALTSFEQNVDLPASVLRAAREKAKDHWRDQKQVRIAQLKAKKIVSTYPHFGILLDLDAYVEDPPNPDALSISAFIVDAMSEMTQVRSLVLERSP